MVSKKGSMELGVNAIVILIIALVILGLGIAFVTNLFRSGGDQLGSIISSTQLPIHADATEPIKFENSELTIKKGSKDSVRVSVYNSFTGAQTDIGLTLVACTDSDGNAGGESFFKIAAPSQQITPGTDAGYKLIINALPDALPEDQKTITYACTVAAGDVNDPTAGGVSTQILLNVVI